MSVATRSEHRHPGLLGHEFLESRDQRAAAREQDAVPSDVAGQLGRRLLERVADRAMISRIGRRSPRGRPPVLSSIAVGSPRDQVPAADLEALLGRTGTTDPIWIFICSAVREPIASLWTLRMYWVIASSISYPPTLIERDTTMPAERDHGHLARAAADVDDHPPDWLLDREPRPDGRRDRLFDQVHPAGAGGQRSLFYRALLDLGDARGRAHDQAADGPYGGRAPCG